MAKTVINNNVYDIVFVYPETKVKLETLKTRYGLKSLSQVIEFLIEIYNECGWRTNVEAICDKIKCLQAPKVEELKGNKSGKRGGRKKRRVKSRDYGVRVNIDSRLEKVISEVFNSIGI
mgnify:CR=1 FL=1